MRDSKLVPPFISYLNQDISFGNPNNKKSIPILAFKTDIFIQQLLVVRRGRFNDFYHSCQSSYAEADSLKLNISFKKYSSVMNMLAMTK